MGQEGRRRTWPSRVCTVRRDRLCRSELGSGLAPRVRVDPGRCLEREGSRAEGGRGSLLRPMAPLLSLCSGSLTQGPGDSCLPSLRVHTSAWEPWQRGLYGGRAGPAGAAFREFRRSWEVRPAVEGLVGGDWAVPTPDVSSFHDPRVAFRRPLPSPLSLPESTSRAKPGATRAPISRWDPPPRPPRSVSCLPSAFFFLFVFYLTPSRIR